MVRITNMLSEAESYAETMEQKDIIFFVGSTGSGKSTSVNYFMGVPLKKSTNLFGDSIIKVDKQKMPNDCKASKIG